MKLFTWNCQGAASTSFRRSLKFLIRVHDPNIVCLLKPKVSCYHAHKKYIAIGFDERLRVEAVGFSGGIWVLWKANIHLEVLHTHPQFVVLQVCHINASPWLLFVVYGSPNQALRRKIFSDLSQQTLNLQGAWVLVGEYNSVVNRDETNCTDSFLSSRFADFQEWIFREGLMDLGYTGPRFTWMRGCGSPTFKAARLDRALCNIDWRIRFLDAEVLHLPIVNSDHALLLV